MRLSKIYSVMLAISLIHCGGAADNDDTSPAPEISTSKASLTAASSGVADQDEASPAPEPSSSEESLLSSPAPSCISYRKTSKGPCDQQNFQVINKCAGTYLVRMDLANFPDTSCKTVGPGKIITLTSGCGFGTRSARGVVIC